MTKTQPNLEHIRHSFSHLLAAAVAELFPDALPAAGPPTEVGFFYDFSFKTAPTESDLKRIEKTMRKILPAWKSFEGRIVSEKEARAFFKNNPYKLELIDDIVAKNEEIRFYTSGSFTDLCRGGHVESVSDLKADAFELISLSGAHWKSDQSKDSLTRITGIAFASRDDLEAYKTMLEEAKKRDHRKIGKEMNLFTFSELVGSGLPLWTPKGTIVRSALNDFVRELRKARGYEEVTIPHITKRALYETSGHWQKFSEELFRIKTREGNEYALKPMNCPHHTQIFASTSRSYRDMPQRYAETTMVYRDEQSGELAGLSRVLSITQDDAHVFCRASQIEDEFFAIWDIVDSFYTTLGFPLSVRLSFHNPNEFEKYIGTRETWNEAERILEGLAEKRGVPCSIGIGEAAMYGPKIDFISKDSIGRTWQVATIQLDFNMPKNFGLYCINEAGEKEDVVMIHAAIMGSIERFTSVMIEHFAGKFPLWVAPVQLVCIPVSAAHGEYALKLKNELTALGFRVEVYDENDSLGKRVRKAKLERVPYIAVIGDAEVESATVSLESRDTESKKVVSVTDLVQKLKQEVASRAIRTL